MWDTSNALKTSTFKQVKLEDIVRSPLGNNTPGGLSQMQLPWPFLKHWVHPVSNGPLLDKHKRHRRPFVSLPPPCPLKQAQPFHSLPLKGSFPLASTQPFLSFPFEGFLCSPPPPLVGYLLVCILDLFSYHCELGWSISKYVFYRPQIDKHWFDLRFSLILYPSRNIIHYLWHQ